MFNKRDLKEILINNDNSLAFQCLYIDIDNLKSVNDLMGRHAGDQLIEKFNLFLDNLSQKFLIPIFKIGGDEYIALSHSKKSISEFKKALNGTDNKMLIIENQPQNKAEIITFLNTIQFTTHETRFKTNRNFNFANFINEIDSYTTIQKAKSYKKLPIEIKKQLSRKDLSANNNKKRLHFYMKYKVKCAINFWSKEDTNSKKTINKLIKTYKTADSAHIDFDTGILTLTGLLDILNKHNLYKKLYFIYFDMNCIKDIHYRYGRENCGVPMINIAFKTLGLIVRSNKGYIARVGGDEGLIVFDNKESKNKFFNQWDSIYESFSDYIKLEVNEIPIFGLPKHLKILPAEFYSIVKEVLKYRSNNSELFDFLIPVKISFSEKIIRWDKQTKLNDIINHLDAETQKLKRKMFKISYAKVYPLLLRNS